MVRLLVAIKGDIGVISLKTLVTTLENELRVLADLDRALSREAQGSLDWVVSGVAEGSIEIEVESRPRIEDKDVGREVVVQLVRTLEDLETGRGTPPFLSERGIKATRGMIGVIGRDGAVGLAVSTPGLQTVDVTPSAIIHGRQLTKVRDKAIGSVEGRLEAISIHGSYKLTVYQSINNRAVTCRLDRDRWPEDVGSLLGARVNISGLVYYNAFGDPFRVDVEEVRRLRSRSDLPRVSDLTGMDPDFTGGLSTEQYIKRFRVG